MAWENSFEARELDLGYSIFEAGNVKNIVMKDHLIEADVLDGDVDHVMIKHHGTTIHAMDCNCEKGREGRHCAHEAAVLFATEEHLEDDVKVDPKDVDELLEFVTEDEAKQFLSILLNGDAALLKQFKKLVRFDERKEALNKDLVDQINSKTDEIIEGYKEDNPAYNNSAVIFLSPQIASYLLDELKRHLDHYVHDFIDTKMYRYGFDVIDHMFSRLDEFYYDHSSTVIKSFIKNMNDVLKTIIGAMEDQSEVYGIIVSHALNKDASIFRDNYFYLLNHAFEDKYYKSSFELAQKMVSSLEENRDFDDSDEKNYQQWVLFLLRLLIRKNDKQEIKILCMKNWKHIKIRRFFSEYCMMHNESRWLINYIEEQIPFEKDKESIYYDHYFLKELYKKSNKEGAYRKELNYMFEHYGTTHLELYREIRSLYSRKKWQEVRVRYLDKVKDEQALAYMYAIDKEYSRLVSIVNGTSDQRVIDRAKPYLKKDHPEVLVNAYKRIANQMVKKPGNRNTYKDLAAILRTMLDIKGGTDQIEYLTNTYIKKYPRRKLMAEELTPLLAEVKAIDDLA